MAEYFFKEEKYYIYVLFRICNTCAKSYDDKYKIYLLNQ